MSNFIVSARKYRPNRFEDVVGQEHISGTLKNALQSGQLAHAFLFCGPRGVGKTTCARILAKVLNCQNISKDFEPCNQCDSCKAFNENASFNITELDAASNNSVEHIRALIEQVRFQPQQGKYKVFIIDEVHMLSQAAFNAFLKTLEEPPSYAIFILATTEKHKILPTILSRCQIYDFRRIQIPDTVAHLQEICEAEGIQAEPDALHIIAQKSDGALRDALSIFDRIVASSGKKVTYQDVISNLNVLDYDYYFRLVDALLLEDISKIFLLFDDILRKGFDAELFINGFSEHLRNLLVCKDNQTLPLLEVSENLQERYRTQAKLTATTLILNALQIANECDIEYKNARNKRLHVEMALVKMNYVQRAVKVANGVTNGVEVEKKNPDITEIPDARYQMPDARHQTLDVDNAVIESETKLVAEPEPTLFSKLKTPEKHALPKLSGGLSALLAEVKQESNGNGATAAELTLENVKLAWQKYVDDSEMPMATKMLFREIELSLNDHHITAKVESSLAENTIRAETGMMEHLRRHFKLLQLTFAIQKTEKIPGAAPPKYQKPLTAREKFIKMRQTNSAVQELQKRFDLRPEED
jgi:DNA polymerase-3 subunit gamma/tau